MHGCAYAVVENLLRKSNIGNGERGTGNGRRLGIGIRRGRRVSREPAASARATAGERGTGKPGDTCGRKVRREKELRVRNDLHWSFVIGHSPRAGNRQRGTENASEAGRLVACRSPLAARRSWLPGFEGRGTRHLPKRQSAANGRESGFRIRQDRVGRPQIAQISIVSPMARTPRPMRPRLSSRASAAK